MPGGFPFRAVPPAPPPPRTQRSHVRQPRVLARIARHSSDPWKKKSSLLFRRGKKSWLRNKGSWLVPLRVDTTGMGRERELRERDSSHKRSRNYSRELRERTPLVSINGANDNWCFTYICSYTHLGSYMSAIMCAPGHHWLNMSKTQPHDLDDGLSRAVW